MTLGTTFACARAAASAHPNCIPSNKISERYCIPPRNASDRGFVSDKGSIPRPLIRETPVGVLILHSMNTP